MKAIKKNTFIDYFCNLGVLIINRNSQKLKKNNYYLTLVKNKVIKNFNKFYLPN